MPETWSLLPQSKPSLELLAVAGGQPLIAKLLVQRGFDTPDRARAFLDPAAYAPAPPAALIGLETAAHLLHSAITAGQNILVWGDFDVDGQTSTSLLVAALRRLAGPEQIRYHVPNRFSEGHGISVAKLQEILNRPEFRPDLVLTCDTGIAEAPAVGYAKDAGLCVVVTDHHDLTPEFQSLFPSHEGLWGIDAADAGAQSVRRADAVVNPKFQAPDDPLRTLPGVGVAYKLIQQLYGLCNRAGEEADLLDLVALGIVADVAEQVNDVRYLLQLGLEQLRNTKRIGLLALMNVARLTPSAVDAEAIGFQLGPRMNALGRLEDATVAVELLTTNDPVRAGQLAAKLERLNQQRRLLTSQITAAAMEMIERNPGLLDFNALALAHPAWHAGIVGIVAARLSEEFDKPSVLLLTPPGQPARGSARSIPGVDIGASIAACHHLLLGHGGHPGAAGLSLLPENIDLFRRELDRQVELHRIAERTPGLIIDAELPLQALDLSLAEQLQTLAPFGQGNPTPQFMSASLQVVEDRRLGQDGAHRRLAVSDGTATLPVIWFHGADVELPPEPIDLVYSVTINEFRGQRTLQLSYIASRTAQRRAMKLGEAAVTIDVQICDLRGQEIVLEKLPPREEASWYAEGMRLSNSVPAVEYAPRTHFMDRPQARSLVLWSIPPSPEILRWLCDAAQSHVIYLCGRYTTDDSLSAILRDVAGMCKYALQRDDRLQIDRMAARLGRPRPSSATVCCGWKAAAW